MADPPQNGNVEMNGRPASKEKVHDRDCTRCWYEIRSLRFKHSLMSAAAFLLWTRWRLAAAGGVLALVWILPNTDWHSLSEDDTLDGLFAESIANLDLGLGRPGVSRQDQTQEVNLRGQTSGQREGQGDQPHALETLGQVWVNATAASGRLIAVVPYHVVDVGDAVFSDSKSSNRIVFMHTGNYEPTCDYIRGPSADRDVPGDELMWTLWATMPVKVYVDFWGGERHMSLGFVEWKDGWSPSHRQPIVLNMRGPGLVFERSFPPGRISLFGNGGLPSDYGPYAVFVCGEALKVTASTYYRNPAEIVPVRHLSQAAVFTDAGHTFARLSNYSASCLYLRGPNKDKSTHGKMPQYTLTVNMPVKVYIDFPDGMKHTEGGFRHWNASWREATDIKGSVHTGPDEGQALRGPGLVFQKTHEAGTIKMGGNGYKHNYLVFICPEDLVVTADATPGNKAEVVRYRTLQAGDKVYTDSRATFTNVGKYPAGCVFVRGPTADKDIKASDTHLILTVNKRAMLYIEFPGGEAHLQASGIDRKDGWFSSPGRASSHNGSSTESTAIEKVIMPGTLRLPGNGHVACCYTVLVCPAEERSGFGLNLDQVLETPAGLEMPHISYGKCALVGSSADLTGRGQGIMIDDHDTVIRVNRVPGEPHKQDFGRRTDVLFLDPISEGKVRITESGVSYRSLGGTGSQCQMNSASCPWKAIILKADSSSNSRAMAEWAELPLVRTSKDIGDFVQRLRNRTAATTGFYAFVTFSLLCDSLTVYGFGGSWTVDSYPMKHVTNLWSEHTLMGLIAKGAADLAHHPNLLTEPYSEIAQSLSKKAQGISVYFEGASATRGWVEMLYSSWMPVHFRSCALVGSSDNLRKAGLGPEIDSHDTVFRVNRVPNAEFARDYGSRTEVLFMGAVSEKKKRYSKTGIYYRYFGGDIWLCAWQARECPFRVVLLKGADRVEYGQNFAERYPKGEEGWKPSFSEFAIGHQSDAVNTFAYRLNNGARPTNGFQAFLTAAVVCKSLTVYGFGGTGTGDGHVIKSVHDLWGEHEMMRHVIDGKWDFYGQPSLLPEDEAIVEKLRERSGQMKMVNPVGTIKEPDPCETGDNSEHALLIDIPRLENFSARQEPDPFLKRTSDCALVGASESLVAMGMGAKIDTHERVFRVARLPTEEDEDDYGHRTDILFTDCWSMYNGSLPTMGPLERSCKGHPNCWSTLPCREGGGRCPKHGLVADMSACLAKVNKLQVVWNNAPFYIGFQKEGVLKALQTVRNVPVNAQFSPGFLAFWLAASTCASVTLYGSEGLEDIRGHEEAVKASGNVERGLLATVLGGKDLDWTGLSSAAVCMSKAVPRVNVHTPKIR